ncbi:MAG: hypothetical protein ACC682_15820 [Gemmatimonadota bacterium]
MSRSHRSVLALLLAAALASCTDAVGPEGSGGIPLQFAVVGPEAVSQAELEALGAAFDRVDQYAIRIVDAATRELIADTTIAITSGGLVHSLDVDVPEDAFGRTVTITLIAYAAGVELYRSVTTTALSADLGEVRVELQIRYTGPGIRGTVTDESGVGFGGVSVGLYQGQSMVRAVSTEADGTYLFLDVAPAQYQLQPTPPSGVTYICPAFRDVTVQAAVDAILADFGTSATFCGTSVLVVSGGDFDDTDVVVTMLGNDPNLTISTFFFVNHLPGIDLLRRHDVVLLFMNGLFDESVVLGTEVADYVALGGNVVLGSFYWQGRSDGDRGSPGWGTLESVDPFASVGGATYQPGVINGNTIVPHALTVGVTALTSTGYWGGVTTRPGTTVVAEWSDDTPLIGYRVLQGGQRLVGVSLFPASGTTTTGDTQAIWENAVRWAGAAGGPVPVDGPGN